ncbi:aldehyde dehydrogenase family protein [Streptomyces phaeochromogenes]|uniref:aldehyde dehydrogenase family protein n=1 Tax=Streptomyces phaeochromogenes TaxID=1923 RepID=UPI003F4D05E0
MIERDAIFIDGKWVDSAGTGTLAVVNPATEESIATVPRGNADDVDRAARAAGWPFELWSRNYGLADAVWAADPSQEQEQEQKQEQEQEAAHPHRTRTHQRRSDRHARAARWPRVVGHRPGDEPVWDRGAPRVPVAHRLKPASRRAGERQSV